MARKYGISFSSKRAIGLSSAKSRLSRQTGIPLTKSGRQRKFGRAAACCVLLVVLGVAVAFGVVIVRAAILP